MKKFWHQFRKYAAFLAVLLPLIAASGCGQGQAVPENGNAAEAADTESTASEDTAAARNEAAGDIAAAENKAAGDTAAAEGEALKDAVAAEGEGAADITAAGDGEQGEPLEGNTPEDNGAESAKETRKDMASEAALEDTGISADADTGNIEENEEVLDPDGSYTTAEDVSLYLVLYGELPQNFITKKEAKALGWSGGSLEPYAPGKCIGGDRFGNYEGLLPEDREYHECDIDTLGAKSRGAKRLVFSDDGLIYYTEDHYESFDLLYGEE